MSKYICTYANQPDFLPAAVAVLELTPELQHRLLRLRELYRDANDKLQDIREKDNPQGWHTSLYSLEISDVGPRLVSVKCVELPEGAENVDVLEDAWGDWLELPDGTTIKFNWDEFRPTCMSLKIHYDGVSWEWYEKHVDSPSNTVRLPWSWVEGA